ncbi:hypothetical protein HMPREF9440_02418 [Sutterella parvirubra YIT 11816]|uniref:Uncharacterized protein n=1 Tax=Sutterella parvirubra YIT 11816 TaxID=762967 RepID=H3KI16_9BURK|nr:hypothetical protein HMPREF9440_02418 [Sutterella parvirubra YIT 11816]
MVSSFLGSGCLGFESLSGFRESSHIGSSPGGASRKPPAGAGGIPF